jgi:hypothetical protein
VKTGKAQTPEEKYKYVSSVGWGEAQGFDEEGHEWNWYLEKQ